MNKQAENHISHTKYIQSLVDSVRTVALKDGCNKTEIPYLVV